MPLLIIALIALNSCCSDPELEKIVYPRPSAPVEPQLIWEDIDEYFALKENDFDALIAYLDEVLGYIEKNNNTYDKYEGKEE